MRLVKDQLDDSINKLDTAYDRLRSCGDVRKADRKRVIEAFEFVSTTTLENRNTCYQNFLKKVRDLYGYQIVALCAIGLGKTTVYYLREEVQSRLPDYIKDKTATWECEVLQKPVENETQGLTNTRSRANIQLIGPTTAAPSTLPADEAHDFEILQKILERKGMSQNKICVEAMGILFPNCLGSTSHQHQHQQSVRRSSTTHQDPAPQIQSPTARLSPTQSYAPELQFTYSQGGIDTLSKLKDRTLQGIQSSLLYIEEKRLNQKQTGRVAVFLRSGGLDGKIVLTAGWRVCNEIVHELDLSLVQTLKV